VPWTYRREPGYRDQCAAVVSRSKLVLAGLAEGLMATGGGGTE
jgi:hypothetical protein